MMRENAELKRARGAGDRGALPLMATWRWLGRAGILGQVLSLIIVIGFISVPTGVLLGLITLPAGVM